MATFSISHEIAASNDSDSASGADSFDEEYYQNKPPPLEYSEELIKRIVHVRVDNGAQVHDALQSVNEGQFKSNVFMFPYKAADLENKNDQAANNVPNYFYNNKSSPVPTGADSSLAIAKKLQTSNAAHSGSSEKLNKKPRPRRSRRNKKQFNNHEYRSDKPNGLNNVETFYNNKSRPLKYEDLVNQIVHVRNDDKTIVPGEQSMNKETPVPSNVNHFETKGRTDPAQAKERRPSNNKSGFNNRNPAAIHQATNVYQNNTKFVTCYNCTAKITESLLSDHLEICTKIRDQVHISLPEDIVAPTPVIQDDTNILEYDNKCSRFCFWCFCPKFCF